jgi:hypothetical protein
LLAVLHDLSRDLSVCCCVSEVFLLFTKRQNTLYALIAMKVTNLTDKSHAPQELVFYTPEELGKLVKLHPATIRKTFVDEPGVIRLGHAGDRKKRQYFTLRIPASVVERVLGRMTVRGVR